MVKLQMFAGVRIGYFFVLYNVVYSLIIITILSYLIASCAMFIFLLLFNYISFKIHFTIINCISNIETAWQAVFTFWDKMTLIEIKVIKLFPSHISLVKF